LRPLDAEAEARIMQKFRLDWNYHSNNIEGNSLTYGETKALILFGITAQGKPLKDHFEITGHNEAINWIIDLVKGDTELTEAFIRQLHTLLLKESHYKEARTQNGNPTRRKIEVGKYKSQPNHVVTVTGETFYFATPEETPARMHELIEWFRKEKEKTDVNPIILSALFHYRFIRIHPFDDGNGRVARILMNFILMQFGYPPAIIKTEDKENYYAVLRLADVGELEPFIEYIAQNLVRSLEIMIRGAKGESIEEPDDLDKELALLERRLIATGSKVEQSKSIESLNFFQQHSFNNFISALKLGSSKFFKFYSDIKINIFILEEENFSFIPNIKLKAAGKVLKSENIKFFDLSDNIEIKDLLTKLPDELLVHVIYSNFRHKELEFTYKSLFRFIFNIKTFQLFDSDNNLLTDKMYSEVITQNESSHFIKVETQRHKDFIEKMISDNLKI
jgi:Fic family protein